MNTTGCRICWAVTLNAPSPLCSLLILHTFSSPQIPNISSPSSLSTDDLTSFLLKAKGKKEKKTETKSSYHHIYLLTSMYTLCFCLSPKHSCAYLKPISACALDPLPMIQEHCSSASPLSLTFVFCWDSHQHSNILCFYLKKQKPKNFCWPYLLPLWAITPFQRYIHSLPNTSLPNFFTLSLPSLRLNTYIITV